MAKIRKGVAYRRLERAYTRRSKYKEKSYVKANPPISVTRFDMGEAGKKFEYNVFLVANSDLQIRHNSLESARQTSNRHLENIVGKSNYHMKIRVYPHHILRENPLAAGAGADRMSTGMSHSFGKPIGSAARVKAGQVVFQVRVDKPALEEAKIALGKASKKLACKCSIVVEKAMKK